MKIHFLGTAAAEGVPNVFCRCDTCLQSRKLGGKNVRTRASVILDDTWKFDYSADSQMQALRDDIDLGQIEHLLVTHTHYDHFQPQDLISRIEGFAHGIEHPLRIYGNDLVMFHSRQALGHFKNRFAFHRMKPFQSYADRLRNRDAAPCGPRPHGNLLALFRGERRQNAALRQ